MGRKFDRRQFIRKGRIMEKLVITRHMALYQYLINKGYVEKGTRCISHASEKDVIGKHVYGVVPYWLASKAEKYTEIQLRIPHNKKGKELTLKEVEFYALRPRTYKVIEV